MLTDFKMRLLFGFLVLLPLVSMEEIVIDWTVNVYLGENVELHCNDSRVMLQQGEVCNWKTPDGLMLSSSYNQGHYTLKNDGHILTVGNITAQQFGLYTVMIHDNGGSPVREYSLRGINLSGPKFRSMNEKYEENIIVAVIAAAVFAVPMTGLCALQKFRYKKDKQETDGNAYIIPDKKSEPKDAVTAYDNPASDFTQL